MKYDSTGTLLWAKLSGSSDEDMGNGVSVDINGNILVAGYVGGSVNGQTYAGGAADIILLEYSSAGVLLTTQLTGTAGDDQGFGVTVSQDGAAYVAGYTDSALNGNTNNGFNDICVVKYSNANYSLGWTANAGAAGDIGLSVAVTDDGFTYVTGGTGDS